MDIQRREAYSKLIYTLLNCALGQHLEILKANQNLIDGGLVETMQQVAAMMAQQGNRNAADYLRNLSAQLPNAPFFSRNVSEPMGKAEKGLPKSDLEGRIAFLEKVLWASLKNTLNPQALSLLSKANLDKLDGGCIDALRHLVNPPEVYKILQANLDKLDDDFIEWFRQWVTDKISNLKPVQARIIKSSVISFGQAIGQFPLGDRAINIEIAIACLETVANFINGEETKEMRIAWLGNQGELIMAYTKRIRGNKAENIEKAIDIGQEALSIVTREQLPKMLLAYIHYNLGAAYEKRIAGKTADNLEEAIRHVHAASEIWTRDKIPSEWANTQHNLGDIYARRILGDRAENLEKAIKYIEASLEVFTREKFLKEWANAQNTLGCVYSERIRGDRAENLEKAIAYYQAYLEVYTREAFPHDWTGAQMNLANAYRDRVKGNRGKNLAEAIVRYQEALQVCTKEADPEKWALIQNHLGIAYSVIPDSEAQEQAIAAYEAALQVYTKDAFPKEWAMSTKNLGIAYESRIRGDGTENLKAATNAFKAAAEVLTRDDLPELWARNQYSQAGSYDKLGQISDAIACCRSALEVYTPGAFPFLCLQPARFLGNIAFAAQRWAEAIEGYSLAIEAVETSRTWAPSESRRQEILADAIDVYANMVQACINAGQLDKAIETVERSRCKRLVDLMASNDIYSGGAISPEVLEYLQEYETLQGQINQQRSQNLSDSSREMAGTDTRSRAAWKAYSSAIASLEAQKQQIWEKLRRLDPVLAGQIQVDAPKLSTIQQLICQPTTAILSFYTTATDTHIFVVRKDQISLHACAGQGFGTLQPWIFAKWLLPYLKNKDEWNSNINAVLKELAQRLHLDELIAQHLADIEELILVPHLGLHQIPFAALPVCEGQFLGDKFLIRYVPSCQVLEFCQQRPLLGESLTYGTAEDATNDLPCASFEGEQIAQMHEIPDRLRLKGSQATIENYRRLLQEEKIQAILSSHHAQSRLDNPLESALKLANGSITVGQLMTPGWRLPHLSDVFLSCCETGLGATKITDDILTLATAFLCAGARCVVNTLWSVDDLATALFSIFYHRYRQQRYSRPKSLQLAQQELRTITGDTLKRAYKPQLEKLLQAKSKEAGDAVKEAKQERDRHPSESSLYQQWDEKRKERDKVARRIHNAKDRLKKCCGEPFPFSHPFYWAAFTCSGLP